MNDDMQKQIKKHFRQMDTLFQPYQLDSFLRTPDDALEDTFFEFTTPVIHLCIISASRRHLRRSSIPITYWTYTGNKSGREL